MKKFIKKKLRSILYFIELFFRIRVESKSPIDVYLDNLSLDCYKFFEADMKKSSIFVKDDDIRKYCISKALKNSDNKDNLFFEFGVYTGGSINLFAKLLSRHGLEIYGFDSFEGLEEDWVTHEFNPTGTFTLNKKTPKVLKNVKIIKGKVQDTLENFLKDEINKKIIFTHMDMDTYGATKYALSKIKPLLTKGSIILFDNFYGFPNWQQHEYKAFTEELKEKEYKYIAFCESPVAIEIL